MKCPKCNSKLKRVWVSVEDAKSKMLSHQCPGSDCYYFVFDRASSDKVIKELEEASGKPKPKAKSNI